MRLASVPLLARVVLALAVVGLLPFAISAYQIRSSRAAIVDQAQLTHKVAARAMADRVQAHLEQLRAAAAAASRHPDLYTDPTTAAAENVLAGLLHAHPELRAAGVFLEGAAAPELIQIAQLRNFDDAIDRSLRLDDARPVVATRLAPGVVAQPAENLWLRLRAPIEQAVSDGHSLNLVLVADAAPLVAAFVPAELGGEAEVVLADRNGEVVSGNVSSLDGFPAEFRKIAEVGQLTSASGEYTIGGGESVIAAYADIDGIPWFVASRQPTRVAESVTRRLRAIAWQAFGGALLLTALLSIGAHTSVVKPIQHLVRAQREMAGLDSEPGKGSEIEQLQEAFASLEQNLEDRDALGRIFLDRYRIIDVLGVGAMGTVFRGWDPKLERPVALKTLRIGKDLEPEERQDLTGRLVKEAVTLARLQHSNIVTVFDVVHEGDAAFIAMELIEGTGLDAYLRWEGLLPEDQVVTLGAALLDALVAAHDAGFVHHDIKPANILLGSDGTIKITDFGVSELLTNAYQKQREDGDLVCGTPGYLAPEALVGEPYTVASDLFAIGVVLYQAIMGARPFFGDTVRETLVQTVTAEVEPPSKIFPDINPLLEGLVLALLEKKPANRPRNAKAAAEVLHKMATRNGWRWQPRPFRSLKDVRESFQYREEDHLSLFDTSDLVTSTVDR